MPVFFVQLPVALAEAVKATRLEYEGDVVARAFVAGIDLARRAQGWHVARQKYGKERRVTQRFNLRDADVTEINRLTSFFGRGRWEIAAAGIHYALRDHAANAIARAARGMGRAGGTPAGGLHHGPRTSDAPSRPGAGLLALAPRRRPGGPPLDDRDAPALARATRKLLGGQTVETTVLFADVRGFTAFTEARGPEGTVSLLNKYLTMMVDCIADEGGMVDKFIGDAIMAGFGVPVPHDDDPDRAVRAAVAMVRALQGWNAERAKAGLPAVEIGIGVNTDAVVTGNIGSPKRMEFTMIGDGVNLASRIESACKQYSARILISEFTRKKLKGAYRMRDVDLVIVKGKTAPVGIYEVLDYHTEKTFPNMADSVARFDDGIRHYRAGDWDRAIAGFRAALEATPGDKLAEQYMARCRQLKADPPKHWRGVWVMEKK